jgi:hypothetical protein
MMTRPHVRLDGAACIVRRHVRRASFCSISCRARAIELELGRDTGRRVFACGTKKWYCIEKAGRKKPASWYSRDASMTSGRALIPPVISVRADRLVDREKSCVVVLVRSRFVRCVLATRTRAVAARHMYLLCHQQPAISNYHIIYSQSYS